MNSRGSILAFSFLAGLSLISCEDKLNDSAYVSAVFTAAWGEGMTKNAGQDSVNSLDILVFDADGCIMNSGRNQYGGSVRLDLPKNRQATCYAVANTHQDLSKVVSESQLLGMNSYLKDNVPDSFEMTGRATHTFNESGEIGIGLERFAVKVVLEGIRLSLSGTSWEASGIDHITITGIYLTNIVPYCNYGMTSLASPASWYNQMARIPNDAGSIVSECMDIAIPNGGCHSTEHVLYAYPNPTEDDHEGLPWSGRHTRLVVQGLLGDSVCYYPVTLPVLERNHCYSIHGLTITGAGSDDPDRYGNRTPLSFSVSITPWTTDEKIIDFS